MMTVVGSARGVDVYRPGPPGPLGFQALCGSEDHSLKPPRPGGGKKPWPPSGGDCYTLSRILHDWSDERCLKILGNCRTAMRGGARLLVIERLLEREPGKTNPMTFLADMHMMVLFPGAKERTRAEFAHLFHQTGFGQPKIFRYEIVVLRDRDVCNLVGKPRERRTFHAWLKRRAASWPPL